MPPAERVNPGGWRTAAAGQRASSGLRAPLSSAKPRVTSGGSWAAPELLGAPAPNPSSPGAAAGSRRLCWSDNPHPSAGSRDPLGPGCCTATSNPHHAHAHTHADTRTHKHTHKPSWPEKPQEPAADSSPSAREEERATGRAGDPASSSQIPAGKAPPEAKKQSELQGNADSNAEISPHPSLKKIASHNWRKKKKKSAIQAQRAVSVAQGSGWTGQEREEECPEQGRGKQMMVCRLLLELALLVGCGASWQLQHQPARCLEMDHLGEGESAREKCYQPEREKQGERESASL